MKRALVLGLAAVTLACSKSEVAQEAPPASAKIEVGSPGPAYSARSMTGDSVSLAGLRGKVVLLNAWATWCGPCRKEIPELRAIHDTYRARGLELVGVSVDADGSDQAIQDFVREFKMDYTIWRDPGEIVTATFRLPGLPATFLFDKQGVIRWKATGVVEPGDTSLTNAIERAISGT
jgi:peroxiredoxin